MTNKETFVQAACDLSSNIENPILFGAKGIIVDVSKAMKSAYSAETIFVQWEGHEKPYPVSPFMQRDSVAMPGQDLVELAKARMRNRKTWAGLKPYRATENGFECFVCESEVVLQEITLSVLDPRFSFAGSGRTITEKLPCCPNCEDPKDLPRFISSYTLL